MSCSRRYNAEKIDGEWVQRLRIHYNCVGEMNISNEPALPIPAVTVNTRKGVFVSYTTDPPFEQKKSECPHSFSNAVRTLAMVRVTGFEPAASCSQTYREYFFRSFIAVFGTF